jgi:hypothetical protein
MARPNRIWFRRDNRLHPRQRSGQSRVVVGFALDRFDDGPIGRIQRFDSRDLTVALLGGSRKVQAAIVWLVAQCPRL